MLALSDKHGEVMASVPGLADMARLTLEETEVALEVLEGPDKYSRTPDNEGRRLDRIEGGWHVLNHAKHRRMASLDERRELNAARQRRWYQKHQKQPEPNALHNVSSRSVTQPSDIAEAEADSRSILPKEKIDLNQHTIQTFLSGRLLANWAVSADLLTVLSGINGEPAKAFHLDALSKLKPYHARTEVVVGDRGDGRSGRVDLVIRDEKGEIGIELDCASPKGKSLFKLQNHFDRWCILLRRVVELDKNRVPTTDAAKKVAHLFSRKLTTPWSENEISAFKAIGQIDLEDLDTVERYYQQERAKGKDGIHRRDLKTFLNNFNGEVDRANLALKRKKSSGVADSKFEAAKLALPGLDQDEWTNGSRRLEAYWDEQQAGENGHERH